MRAMAVSAAVSRVELHLRPRITSSIDDASASHGTRIACLLPEVLQDFAIVSYMHLRVDGQVRRGVNAECTPREEGVGIEGAIAAGWLGEMRGGVVVRCDVVLRD